jgi:rhodanese-related sulfurtransferase
MRYSIFLLLFLFTLACSQAPEQKGIHSPGQVLVELNSTERLMSPEEVADRLINEDPSQLLVDVRSHAEYDAFSLPGAINIPLENLMEEGNQQLIDCSRYTAVFFSNDDVLSTQAWTLNRINGCKGAFIMQGGLNRWTANLMTPVMPAETAPEGEWELYNFRKAVAQYLIGGSEALEPEEFPVVRKKVVVARKKVAPQPKPKKKVVVEEEEGC